MAATSQLGDFELPNEHRSVSTAAPTREESLFASCPFERSTLSHELARQLGELHFDKLGMQARERSCEAITEIARWARTTPHTGLAAFSDEEGYAEIIIENKPQGRRVIILAGEQGFQIRVVTPDMFIETGWAKRLYKLEEALSFLRE